MSSALGRHISWRIRITKSKAVNPFGIGLIRRFAVAMGLVFMGLVMSSCTSSPFNSVDGKSTRQASTKPASSTETPVGKETKSAKAQINHKTKFSSRDFGVKGSPRVTTKKRVRKGGGRYQVGKPYKIRGRWYYPKEDPNYKGVGLASWYGPNFHGRLTANGEIYDQYSLSAAHPTMPLPSYAKVTNLENGASVTVRVNDRGPFSKGREIDLSARAAELLGYTKKGLAKVRVEYVGKARMDGKDEEILLASYVPAGGKPSDRPGTTLSGTMLASLEQPKHKQVTTAATTHEATPKPAMMAATAFKKASEYDSLAAAKADAIVADGKPLDLLANNRNVKRSKAEKAFNAQIALNNSVVPRANTSGLQPIGYAAEAQINARIQAAFSRFDQKAPQANPTVDAMDIKLTERVVDLGYVVSLVKAEKLEHKFERHGIVMIEKSFVGYRVKAFTSANRLASLLSMSERSGIRVVSVNYR